MASSNSSDPRTNSQPAPCPMMLDTNYEATHTNGLGEDFGGAGTQPKIHGGTLHNLSLRLKPGPAAPPPAQQENEVLQTVKAIAVQLAELRTDVNANTMELRAIRTQMDTTKKELSQHVNMAKDCVCFNIKQRAQFVHNHVSRLYNGKLQSERDTLAPLLSEYTHEKIEDFPVNFEVIRTELDLEELYDSLCDNSGDYPGDDYDFIVRIIETLGVPFEYPWLDRKA
ncbi:hypothetical protein SLS58_002914 [Diplodia intermedia]|uniref:Uncharacterized protein n=1 Tax=Diplodia intermedia TaxID=856260 RepID=A0ABR3TY47_9PEZI